MKPHKSIMLLPFLLAMQSAFAQSNHLTLSDNYPSASAKIKFTYSLSGSVLESKKDINAQVFFIDGKDFPTADVDLKTKGQVLVGEFTIPAEAKAFFIKVFSDADIDNNNSKGFVYKVYKNKKPVAGAYESMGFILTGDVGNRFAKIKTDHDAVIALYKQEHDFYPQGEKLFDHNYYYLLGLKRDTASRAILFNKLKSLETNTGETDLHLAAFIYDWLGKKSSADSLNNIVKAKFPKGEMVVREAVYTILGEKDIARKDSLYNDFVAKYPDSKNSDLENIRTELVAGYLEAGNYKVAEKYAGMIRKKSNLASCYNGVAYEWALTGTNLELAEKLSKQSLDIMLESRKHPDQRPFYSPRAIDKLYRDMYYQCADSYAYILYVQKRYNEALNYQKEVYADDKNHRLTVIEHYALILNKLGKYDESKKVIEKFLKMSRSNDVLYNELKIAYVGLNKSEAGFDKYFDATSKQSMN